MGLAEPDSGVGADSSSDAAPPHATASAEDIWRQKTLLDHEIFHDQFGTLVDEIIVLNTDEMVEHAMEVLADRYCSSRSVRARKLELPILMIFNRTDGQSQGVHFSALLGGADGRGMRYFEPATRGMRGWNKRLILKAQMFFENHAEDLRIGSVPDRAHFDHWHNSCPPQTDTTNCGHTLRQALFQDLRLSRAS